MAQTVIRRPLMKESVLNLGLSEWDLWCTKWHRDIFFSQYSVFPCHYHSTNAPHSSSPARCLYQMAKGQSLVILQKAMLCRQSGGLDRKVVRYSFLFRRTRVDVKSFLEVTSCNFEYGNKGSTINTLQQMVLWFLEHTRCYLLYCTVTSQEKKRKLQSECNLAV